MRTCCSSATPANTPRSSARRRVCDRVRVIGHVEDAEIGAYLAASDVCLCLRWPTALETSASWLHCLAAQRATVVTDLAHLADVPCNRRPDVAAGALDPRAGYGGDRSSRRGPFADGRRCNGLRQTARCVTSWPAPATTIGKRQHTLDAMETDYRRADVCRGRTTRPRSDRPAGAYHGRLFRGRTPDRASIRRRRRHPSRRRRTRDRRSTLSLVWR